MCADWQMPPGVPSGGVRWPEIPNPLLHRVEPMQLDQRVGGFAEQRIIIEALNIHQGRIKRCLQMSQIPQKALPPA